MIRVLLSFVLARHQNLSILIPMGRNIVKYSLIFQGYQIKVRFGVTALYGACRKESFLNFLQMAKLTAAIASRSRSRPLIYTLRVTLKTEPRFAICPLPIGLLSSVR